MMLLTDIPRVRSPYALAPAVAFLLAAMAGCSSLKVSSEHDETVDF